MKKYSALDSPQISGFISPSRLIEEGRTRRHERGGGMRWTRVRRQTTGARADGEIVWSWRSDAGAKVVKTLSRLTGDGGNQAWSPGRSRISRKTIAQGRPDDPPVPVVLPRAFLLHADHGCGGHPAFPAPSSVSRAVRFQQLGRSRAARTKIHVSLRRHAGTSPAMTSECVARRIRRTNSPSSRASEARPGTHNHRGQLWTKLWLQLRATRTLVVMSPRVREDDEGFRSLASKRDDGASGRQHGDSLHR